MLKATITLEAKTWAEIKEIGEKAFDLLKAEYRQVRNNNGLRSFGFDVTGEEEKESLLPLFRATFIRGRKNFNVVFRVQEQEAAIPYLEENFGTKPMMWNIEIQPITDPAPYTDLGNGYIRDESIPNEEE